MLGTVSVHRWSMQSSGTIGSVSGTRKESLEAEFGEWVALGLLGDWALLEKLNLCTPEKEWTPRAGECERLQEETGYGWEGDLQNHGEIRHWYSQKVDLQNQGEPQGAHPLTLKPSQTLNQEPAHFWFPLVFQHRKTILQLFSRHLFPNPIEEISKGF